MLKIDTKIQGSAIVVRLSGDIGEGVDFQTSIGEGHSEILVYCKDVARINSVGVKAWIRYFSGITIRGAKLKFFECSHAIMEQINLVMNFNCGGSVESICLPYFCPKCHSTNNVLVLVETLRKDAANLPEPPCLVCKEAKMEFDDIPSEYFTFLNRT